MGCIPSKENQTITDTQRSDAKGKENYPGNKRLASTSDPHPTLHTEHSHVSVTYQLLPPGSKSHRVRNVADGDTLTLKNGDRIRFLGIDCPELKEKHPFALEAKAYTKALCDQKDIWISFATSNVNQKDHYGRLLAIVWVSGKDGYICVNEGLVFNGFASVYAVDKITPNDGYFHKLLTLQRKAREGGIGIWKTFQNYHVWVTRTGTAYHMHEKDASRQCQHLRKSKHLRKTTAIQAMDEGFHPCRSCISGLVPQ